MTENHELIRAVEQYQDTVYRVAFNYMKQKTEADDITQDVFVKLYRTERRFESDEHLKYWLIRVTVNCCKKALLSPWRKHEPIEDYAQTLSFTTPEHSELFYLTMELPRKYRIAIYLYYYEEYSTEEIGKLLGIPRATVATHLRRGRALLKKRLMEAEEHHE